MTQIYAAVVLVVKWRKEFNAIGLVLKTLHKESKPSLKNGSELFVENWKQFKNKQYAICCTDGPPDNLLIYSRIYD